MQAEIEYRHAPSGLLDEPAQRTGIRRPTPGPDQYLRPVNAVVILLGLQCAGVKDTVVSLPWRRAAWVSFGVA
jgi:hypothetical protein